MLCKFFQSTAPALVKSDKQAGFFVVADVKWIDDVEIKLRIIVPSVVTAAPLIKAPDIAEILVLIHWIRSDVPVPQHQFCLRRHLFQLFNERKVRDNIKDYYKVIFAETFFPAFPENGIKRHAGKHGLKCPRKVSDYYLVNCDTEGAHLLREKLLKSAVLTF